MSFNGFFVDDHEEIYAILLSKSDPDGISIEYRPLKEAATLAGELFDATPDIVALDFRLDDNPQMIDPKKAYNGSGLAQLLRDKASATPQLDFPIVLVSAEDNLERFYRPDGTAHDLFDRIYKKEEVSENPESTQSQLVSLCSAYAKLKSVWDVPAERLSVFGLEIDEVEVVATQELRSALLSAGAPHIAARIILKGLIDRSGILFSDDELAARLGISELGPMADILIKNNIFYDGVFSGGWRRWWAHRFDDWAIGIFGARPSTLTGTTRASILNNQLDVTVAAATSTWNGSSDERFAFSCCVCNRAGEVRHSVAAFDPNAPRYSIRKRICWDCIQTDRYLAKKIEVDDVDAGLADEVKSKSRSHDGFK